jgi:hypothetical protein
MSSSYTLKLKGSEVSVNSSAQTAVSNASLVRLFNNGASQAVITQYLGGNTSITVGAFTLQANNENILQKAPTDTLGASTASGVLGTPIGFRD